MGLEDVGLGKVEGRVAHFDVGAYFATGFAVLAMIVCGLCRGVNGAVALLKASRARGRHGAGVDILYS